MRDGKASLLYFLINIKHHTNDECNHRGQHLRNYWVSQGMMYSTDRSTVKFMTPGVNIRGTPQAEGLGQFACNTRAEAMLAVCAFLWVECGAGMEFDFAWFEFACWHLSLESGFLTGHPHLWGPQTRKGKAGVSLKAVSNQNMELDSVL